MTMIYSQTDMEKAQELVRNDKLIRLKGDEFEFDNMYIVTGQRDDYLVVSPLYCSCEHFLLTCIKEPGRVCKHILATHIAGDNIREEPAEQWQEYVLRER